MRLILLIGVFFFENHLFSQCLISGRITDSLNQPIPDANIVILKKNHIGIIEFTNSDKNGNYTFDCVPYQDSLVIRVSIIGYAVETKNVFAKKQTVDFVLTPKIIDLPSIEVSRESISTKGDTINYSVAFFANKQDRFIGDVIGKIPGIEIDASGRIKYNGKAINVYYINGLNLLEGRYSIANQNIPYDMVDRVQVFQNHQPIKILESSEKSTIPALNIELKKGVRNKFVGGAKVSLGFPLLLSEDELTGLKFAKNAQLISAYKFNNTGLKLSNEIVDQIKISHSGESDAENKSENILSVISLPMPLLQTNRYLFNNNHLFHLSKLSELKNKAYFKLNVSYLNDINDANGLNRSTFFFPTGDSLLITEIQKNSFNTNKVNVQTIYELNSSQKYLKNGFKVYADFINQIGVINNSSNVLQQLLHPFYLLQNDFNIIFPVKHKLISFLSTSFASRDNQQLEVSPGSFPEVFNDSIAYKKAAQYTYLDKFSSKNKISFNAGKNAFQYQLNAGADVSFKKFNSFFEKLVNQTSIILNDSFQNKINWNNFLLYISSKSVFKKGSTKLEIEFPIEWNIVSLENKILNFKTAADNIFVSPKIELSIPFASDYLFEGGYSRQNIRGDFLQTTKGFILTTYRNLSQRDTILPFQKVNSYVFGFSYKNPLRAFSYNLFFTYSSVEKNLLTAQSYNNFYITNTSVTFPNVQKQFLIKASTNKYILDSRINLLFTFNYGHNTSLQLQNSKLVDVLSNETSVSFKFNFNKLLFISFESNSNYNYFRNTINNYLTSGNNFSFSQFQQDTKVFFFLKRQQTIYFNTSLYKLWDNISQTRSYFFGDLGAKKKFKKIELQAELKNIANVDTYTNIFLLGNVKQVAQTQIRPRSVLLQCYFNF